jgi:hypothetical protein
VRTVVFKRRDLSEVKRKHVQGQDQGTLIVLSSSLKSHDLLMRLAVTRGKHPIAPGYNDPGYGAVSISLSSLMEIDEYETEMLHFKSSLFLELSTSPS